MKKVLFTITLFFMIPWATIIASEKTPSAAITIPTKTVASPTPVSTDNEEIDFPEQPEPTTIPSSSPTTSYILSLIPALFSSAESEKITSTSSTYSIEHVHNALKSMKSHQRVSDSVINQSKMLRHVHELVKRNDIAITGVFITLATEKAPTKPRIFLDEKAKEALGKQVEKKYETTRSALIKNMQQKVAALVKAYGIGLKDIKNLSELYNKLGAHKSSTIKIPAESEKLKETFDAIVQAVLPTTQPDTQQPQTRTKA